MPLFVLVASVALLVQLWGYGIAEGEEAVRTAVFQAISIITTTGFATTDFALWPVISLLTLFALMFVGRLCRIDDRVDQGRPPPAPRKGAAPRARSDREPRGGHADPLQRRPGRRAHPARDRCVHPPLRRVLGGRCLGHRHRLGDLERPARPARHARRRRRVRSGTAAPASGSRARSDRSPPLGDVSKITMIVLMWLGRLEIIPVFVLATRHYWRL